MICCCEDFLTHCVVDIYFPVHWVKPLMVKPGCSHFSPLLDAFEETFVDRFPRSLFLSFILTFISHSR